VATDSFTSSASAAFTGIGVVLTDTSGAGVYTAHGYYIRVDDTYGVSISKAPSFGGVQAALTFPQTLDNMRDLVAELIKAVN